MQSERYVSPYYFGMLYAALGELDEAFRWLEKTIGRARLLGALVDG
jgi:hypothetical protein